MNFLQIAARISNIHSIELHGPFKRSHAENTTELDIPFGFSGKFSSLLGQVLGTEDLIELQSGPIDGVPIGYQVTNEHFVPGSGQPDDPTVYESELQITHIAGYELSPEDKHVVNSALDEILHHKVDGERVQELRSKSVDHNYD